MNLPTSLPFPSPPHLKNSHTTATLPNPCAFSPVLSCMQSQPFARSRGSSASYSVIVLYPMKPIQICAISYSCDKFKKVQLLAIASISYFTFSKNAEKALLHQAKGSSSLDYCVPTFPHPNSQKQSRVIAFDFHIGIIQ